MTQSGSVQSFRDEMRSPFDGTLPEISVYFARKENIESAISLFVENSYLPASTMQREGSAKRELLSSKVTPRELVKLVESGRHVLLKKPFGLPDIGLGVLEDTMRIDFRTGPEWNDQQISRLVEALQKLREKVEVADIFLDEMEEHFSQQGTCGFQELLEG